MKKIDMKLCTGPLLALSVLPIGLFAGQSNAQSSAMRMLSGTVVTSKNEIVANVTIVVRWASGEQKAVTDAEGNFRLQVPMGGVQFLCGQSGWQTILRDAELF